MLLEGLHIPLTTPFFADGRLHLRKLQQNVQRYSLTPAAGMIVLGANGEASLLSESETLEVFGAAIEYAAPAKVMIAGVSQSSLRATIDLLEAATRMSYDAALLEPPQLPGITADEVRTYLQMAADSSPLPIVLTGNLPIALIGELAFHPNIFGYLGDFAQPMEIRQLKEQTAGVQRPVTVTSIFTAVTRRMLTQETPALLSPENLTGGVAIAAQPAKPALKTREKLVSFQILNGKSDSMMDTLEAGAVGAAPLLAAAAPQSCYEVYAAWKDGDLPLSAEKQVRLQDAIHWMEGKEGVAAVKYGCDLNGYFGGPSRHPFLPLNGAQRKLVEDGMRNLRG